jgi:hypothetical protein
MRLAALYTTAHAREDAARLAPQRDMPVSEVTAMTTPDPFFREVRYSPDGKRLAALYGDRLLRVLDISAIRPGADEACTTLRARPERPALTTAPAIDVAWFPLADEDNAFLLAASQGVPLQMHDLSDGTVRGSYVVKGEMDEVLHPTSCLWLGDGARILGGYGPGRLVFHDISRVGDHPILNYRSRIIKSSIGAVSALAVLSTISGTGELIAAGNRLGCVELYDTRLRLGCAFLAAEHFGGGITQMAVDPATTWSLLTASRGPKSAGIVEFDLRHVRRPVAVLQRPKAETNQKHGFVVVPPQLRARFDGCRVVAASAAGGLLGYRPTAVDDKPPSVDSSTTFEAPTQSAQVLLPVGEDADDDTVDLQKRVAPTAGVALHWSPDFSEVLLAVTVGARPTRIRDTYEERGPTMSHADDAAEDADVVRSPRSAAAAGVVRSSVRAALCRRFSVSGDWKRECGSAVFPPRGLIPSSLGL